MEVVRKQFKNICDKREKYEEKMNKLYKKLVRNVSARDIFHSPIACKVIKRLAVDSIRLKLKLVTRAILTLYVHSKNEGINRLLGLDYFSGENWSSLG